MSVICYDRNNYNISRDILKDNTYENSAGLLKFLGIECSVKNRKKTIFSSAVEWSRVMHD